MLIYIEIPIIKTQKINFRMTSFFKRSLKNPRRIVSGLRSDISEFSANSKTNKEMLILVISIITIVIAISGCIENTNTKHNLSDNTRDNTSDNTCLNNSDNIPLNNPSDNITNNTEDNANITSNTNSTGNATINAPTGENKNNIIVVITISNDALLKISVKNIEIYSKIYGWKTLNKLLNRTDNQSTHSGNLPAGKYVQIRINASNISAKIKISNLTPLGNASFEDRKSTRLNSSH